MATGETVVDAPPMLAARARVMRSGQKNDPNDARSVSRATRVTVEGRRSLMLWQTPLSRERHRRRWVLGPYNKRWDGRAEYPEGT